MMPADGVICTLTVPDWVVVKFGVMVRSVHPLATIAIPFGAHAQVVTEFSATLNVNVKSVLVRVGGVERLVRTGAVMSDWFSNLTYTLFHAFFASMFDQTIAVFDESRFNLFHCKYIP